MSHLCFCKKTPDQAEKMQQFMKKNKLLDSFTVACTYSRSYKPPFSCLPGGELGQGNMCQIQKLHYNYLSIKYNIKKVHMINLCVWEKRG